MDPITSSPLAPNYRFEADAQANNEANFNNAVDTRNQNQLLQVAQQAGTNTPVGQAALSTASTIQNRTNEFATTVKPIDAAGGAATPQGRQAIAKVFATTADQPLYGQALIAYITGNKEQAFNLWTGGVNKTSIEYANNNGNILEKITNGLGELVSIFDTQTGQNLSKEEYSRRGGSVSTLADTLAGKTLEANRGLYNTAFNQEKEKINNWQQTYGNLSTKIDAVNNFFGSAKTDLPPDLYAQALKTVGQSMGLANNVSNSKTGFDQIVKDAGSSNGVTVTDQINAKLGTKLPIGSIINLDASGSRLVTKDNKFNESINDLKSRQSTDSKSAENTKNTTETFDSIIKSDRFQNALKGKSDKDKALFIQRFENALRFSNDIGNEIARTTDKFGKPSFISLPTSASFTDPQALVMTQMAQHAHNAKQIDAYGKYFKANEDMYSRTNTLPVPGAIGAAYVKRPEFKEINATWASTIDGILANEYVARNAANAAKTSTAAPTAITSAVSQAVAIPRRIEAAPITPVVPPQAAVPAQVNAPAQVVAPAQVTAPAQVAAPVQAAAPVAAAVPPPAPAPAPVTAPAPAAPAKLSAPKVGDVVTHEGKKYRYKGGGPNKQSNWTEVK